VELPELDHRIDESWPGLSAQVREVLTNCLQRTVELRLKGRATKITLQPNLGPPLRHPSDGPVLTKFRLRDVVRGSHLLLSSSDVTRVKVTRKDPASGQVQAMQFNLEAQMNDNDLWLRDGDIIEVPEK
jgi:hypothetical protein